MAVNEIGTFTPEQARLLWQDYQERRQLQPQLTQNFPRRRTIDQPSPHRVFVRNTTDEIIPSFACMEVMGTEVFAGKTVVRVRKPTTLDANYLFNSEFAIKVAGEFESGVGWAYRFGVVRMIGTAPTSPAQFRPTVGAWTVAEGDGPFVVYGADNTFTDALIGRIESVEGVYLVATGSGIPARSGTTAGSATVTVQEIVGATITPTSKTITAYNISAVAIPADCYTVVREDRFGDFIADPPAVTDLRLDGLNFQLRRNCDWSTWLTGEPCDE